MREYVRIIMFLLMASMLYACSTVKYVPVETIKVDTTYVSQIKIYTVYEKDSVYIKAIGDTVFQYKYKYLYKYIE